MLKELKAKPEHQGIIPILGKILCIIFHFLAKCRFYTWKYRKGN
jgi:hypothetical protein